MRPGWVVAILALTGFCALAGDPPPPQAPGEAPAAPSTQATAPQTLPSPQSAPARPGDRRGSRRPVRPRGAPQREAKAEEVLHAVLEAHGGEQRLKGVQSLFIRSRLVKGEGVDLEESLITQYWKAPNLYRREMETDRGVFVMSYNGRYAWNDMGQGVAMAPRASYRDIEDIVRDINEPLSHLDPGNTLRYEGEREIDGRSADVVLVIRPSGKMKRLLVDRETRRILQKEVALFNEPEKVVARRRMADYRQIEGIWIPHVEQDLLAEIPTRLELVNFVPNQAIDDRVFDSPVPPFEESLRPPSGSR